MLWKWNIEDNSVDCIHVCRGHERSLECVSVNRNSTLMATGGWDTLLKIWTTCKLLGFLKKQMQIKFSRLFKFYFTVLIFSYA